MRIPILLLASAAFGACHSEGGPTATTESSESGDGTAAIIDGHRDEHDPAVVALVGADGEAYCTGTLIAPQVVLTAAHCIVIHEQVVMPARVVFGTESSMPTSTIDVAWAEPHPHFGGTTYFNDAALIGLARESDVAPVPIRRAGLGDNDLGHPLRFVGFGLTGDRKVGTKREASVPLKTLEPEFLIYGQVTCNGDSGGPAFLDNGAGVEELVGVTSHGPIGCSSFGTFYSTRVDSVAQWIESRIVTPCSTCQLDGRCTASCPADPDCGCPSDGICSSCEGREDPDCALSSVDEPCAGAGTCEPGAFCVDDVCLRACDPERFGACSSSEFCGTGTGESRTVCFTESSLRAYQAGCAATGDSAGLAGVGLLLGLILFRRRH